MDDPVEPQHVQEVLYTMPPTTQQQGRQTYIQHIHVEVCLLHARWHNVVGVALLWQNSYKLEIVY